MHPSCPALISQYDQLTALKQQFDGALEEAAKTREFDQVRQIQGEVETVMANLDRLMMVFIETVEGKEITLDVREVKASSEQFYQEHDLQEFIDHLPAEVHFSSEAIERIREALKMGFDQAIILPESEFQKQSVDKLGDVLASQPIEHLDSQHENQYSQAAYFEGGTKTYDVNNRPFGKSYMLMYSSKPVPQETKNLNPDQLDELFVEKKWNGMTLGEYLVLQRKEFEQRGNHGFDAYSSDSQKSNWTWLLDSTIGSDKVVYARWHSVSRQVEVYWSSRAYSFPLLGARPVVVVEIT